MKKREADFQTIFGKYVKAKNLYGNFELKQTPDDSIDFNDKRQRRQISSIVSAAREGYYWKHSDADPREKPFDCSNVPPIPGYVAIKYPGFFCIIPVDVFVLEDCRSKRRSLTSQRAKEIASHIVIL